MPTFLSGSFTFWGIVAAQGRVRARSLWGPALRSPTRGSAGFPPGRHSRRRLIAVRKVMLQREKGEGSCAGCERLISIGQGNKTWGLQRNCSGSSCHLALPLPSKELLCSPELRERGLRRARAWHSRRAAFSCYGGVTTHPFLDTHVKSDLARHHLRV